MIGLKVYEVGEYLVFKHFVFIGQELLLSLIVVTKFDLEFVPIFLILCHDIEN